MIERCLSITYPVLAVVSNCYPRPMGRLLMYYSPVRHSCLKTSPQASVRLACIRHAASVHPEPGSNSPLSFSIFRQFHVFLTLSFFLSLLTCLLFSFQCPCRPLSRVLIYNTIYPLPLQVFFSFFFVFLSLFF